jgi:hypothetical protein
MSDGAGLLLEYVPIVPVTREWGCAMPVVVGGRARRTCRTTRSDRQLRPGS